MTDATGNQKVRSFMDLRAWKEGHDLVIDVYKVTASFPASEQFGLSNQLRRAVVSVTSNVAEGFSRRTSKEKVQFYRTSLGSVTEVRNQLLVARDVHYMDERSYRPLEQRCVDVSKLLHGLIRSAATQPTRTEHT